MDIIDAIKARTSVRAFLSKPVAQDTISEILAVACFAASSKNTQPWDVAVVSGKTKQKISEQLLELDRKKTPINPELTIEQGVKGYYQQRAIDCGIALYGALGIKREDKEKRQQQWEKNFSFFGAPIELFFFCEPSLGNGAILDCGMFIQNVMLVAQTFGLSACLQRSVVHYPQQVKEILGDKYTHKMLLTGMALGYPDTSAPENNYRTERAPLEQFVDFFSE